MRTIIFMLMAAVAWCAGQTYNPDRDGCLINVPEDAGTLWGTVPARDGIYTKADAEEIVNLLEKLQGPAVSEALFKETTDLLNKWRKRLEELK